MMTSKSNEASPAERYKRAKSKAGNPEFELFTHELRFPLDDFQERACLALEADYGVLVAAPTGAGKTVIGEFAIHVRPFPNCSTQGAKPELKTYSQHTVNASYT